MKNTPGKNIKDKIADTVRDLALDQTVHGVEPSAVNAITNAVSKQVVPEILFQTNQEGFFRSYVNNGSILTLVGAVYGLGYAAYTTGAPPSPEVVIPALAGIAGALSSLFGRNIATRPIGQ